IRSGSYCSTPKNKKVTSYRNTIRTAPAPLFLLPGMRDHVGHARLDLAVEERIVEIMRPPRGRIMNDDGRRCRLLCRFRPPRQGKPKLSNCGHRGVASFEPAHPLAVRGPSPDQPEQRT